MRGYKDEQINSHLFEGEDAEKITSLRKQMDQEASDICGRLQEAFNMAEEEFKQLALRYEPQFQSVLKGTEFENTPIGMVGFDFSHAEKHGVVFAQQIKRNPMEVFLDLLRKTTEDGPNVTDKDDRIYVEPKHGDVAGVWGARSDRMANA